MSDLQSDVAVANGKITGTLIYNEGWESGPLAGPGYFMALKFSSEDWNEYDSIKVGLNPSIETGLVEVKNDPDKNGVFKISDRATQKFIVQTRVGSITTRTQYDLSELVYQEPSVDSMLIAPSATDIINGVVVGSVQEDVAIAAGTNPGEFVVTGESSYDSETGSPAKYRIFLKSKDNVGQFDNYAMKGVVGGETSTLSGELMSAFYYGSEYGFTDYAFAIAVTVAGAAAQSDYDDIYLEITLDGATEKYSLKEYQFAPAQ